MVSELTCLNLVSKNGNTKVRCGEVHGGKWLSSLEAEDESVACPSGNWRSAGGSKNFEEDQQSQRWRHVRNHGQSSQNYNPKSGR